MIIIDTNALILLIVGLIGPERISSHKRLKNYDEQDFFILQNVIRDFRELVVLPNIWTEVDNLMDKAGLKYHYIQILKSLTQLCNEEYYETKSILENDYITELGLTDSIILKLAIDKNCQKIITADSRLGDYAKSNGIEVIDLVEIRNNRLFRK